MRIYETREHSIHFDPSEMPEPLMVEWGGFKRRRRLQPRSVMIEWRHGNHGGAWHLSMVAVFGEHVHAQSGAGISTYFVGMGQDRPMPDWLAELVDASHPHASKAVSA